MALSLGHTDYSPPGQSAVEHRNTAFLATPGTAASPLPGKIAKYMRKSIQHPTHKITGKAEKILFANTPVQSGKTVVPGKWE